MLVKGAPEKNAFMDQIAIRCPYTQPYYIPISDFDIARQSCPKQMHIWYIWARFTKTKLFLTYLFQQQCWNFWHELFIIVVCAFCHFSNVVTLDLIIISSIQHTAKTDMLNAPMPNLKCFSSRLAVVFSQSIEAKSQVEHEDVVGVLSDHNLFHTKDATYIRYVRHRATCL